MRDDMYIFFHSSKRLFILGGCPFAVVRLSFWFIDYFLIKAKLSTRNQCHHIIINFHQN